MRFTYYFGSTALVPGKNEIILKGCKGGPTARVILNLIPQVRFTMARANYYGIFTYIPYFKVFFDEMD